MGDNMKKALNFILNQLGLVVVVVAAILIYYDILPLTKEFALIVCLVLGAVFIASQLTYRSLQKDKRAE